MMKKWLKQMCGVLCASVLLPTMAAHADTVKIGILHSLSGTMAISETSLRDVVLMAVEEINAAGGIKVGGKGYMIDPVVVDPASNWPLFAEKGKQLIVQEKVACTFGCWTSVSRKSVLPVYEAKYTMAENPYGGGLLFYPVQYEGEEQSPNIFYTGASPNEQLIPAAEYMMGKEGGNRKKFYLLGTDYVFPRTANKVLKAFLKAKGVADANVAEEYTPFSHSDYQTIVAKIKDFAKDGDACVLSTINGDSNVPFYKEFANQGLTADKCPIMAFSVAEDELRSMETEKLVGHLAAWNYYQAIDNPENKKFVMAFKKYCKEHKLPGGEDRVTDDPIEAAYFGVYVWKNACEKAGSFEITKVIPAVLGQKFMAPGGEKQMDTINHHTWKPVLIGSIRADGQFDIVSQTPLVKPDSFSGYLHGPDELKKLTGAP